MRIKEKNCDNIVEKIDTFPNDKARKLKSKIKDYFLYRFRYSNKYDLLYFK